MNLGLVNRIGSILLVVFPSCMYFPVEISGPPEQVVGRDASYGMCVGAICGDADEWSSSPGPSQPPLLASKAGDMSFRSVPRSGLSFAGPWSRR